MPLLASNVYAPPATVVATFPVPAFRLKAVPLSALPNVKERCPPVPILTAPDVGVHTAPLPVQPAWLVAATGSVQTPALSPSEISPEVCVSNSIPPLASTPYVPPTTDVTILPLPALTFTAVPDSTFPNVITRPPLV